MDYHNLKRRELQALCKEHNIPANSANSVLADKLSQLLNEKQKPELKRQAKKVRFSPDDHLVEFEPEKQKDTVTQTRSRRHSSAKKAEAVESVNDSTKNSVRRTRSTKADVVPTNEENQGRRVAEDAEKEVDIEKDIKGNAGKVTRLKSQASQKGGADQSEGNKQSKRVAKIVEKEGEPVKEAVVVRARVTRSKAQTVEGGAVHDVKTMGKKKSGKQVVVNGQNVESDKETMDVPVRATRSKKTVKEDIADVVSNPQADNKRTRRQMKATDLSSNLSQTAPVDKQEPPKRKSLRTRALETVEGDQGDKVEVVSGSRTTRSKAPLVMEGSGRNGKNKANKVEIQQVEEPPKHASKRNVSRRKFVFQPEKIEADVHLDEPVNLPVGKNTRRKSVIPEVSRMVKSTVRKNQPKTQSGKEATSESPKLRKGKETLNIEDPVIEAGYGSSVKSLKSSASSTPKSAGKSVMSKKVKSPVIRNQQSKAQSGKELTSESPKSRKRKGVPVTEDPIIEHGSIVKSPRSSARSASKRAGKPGKVILDPAVNTAPGRMTRTRFKHGGDAASSFSEQIGKKKQKSVSAYKKQLHDDAQRAVPEAAELGPDLDDDTTGVQSAFKQPLHETRMSTPEVEEVQPNPDIDTVEILGSESVMLPIKVAEENSVSVSGPSTLMDVASLVSGEKASGEVKEDSGAPIEESTNEESSSSRLTEDLVSGKQQDPTELHVFDVDTPLGGNSSHFDMPAVSVKNVVGNVPDPASGVSNLQDQNEVHVEFTKFSESVRSDTNEKEMQRTESGTSLKGLQADGMVEEPLVSVGKSDGEDGSVGAFKEQEMFSVAQPVCKVTDDLMLSGRDGGVTTYEEHKSSPDVHDTLLVTTQTEPVLEPPVDDVIESHFSGSDMFGNPLMEESDVHNDGINVPKELEPGSEQSTANKSFEVLEEDDVGGDDSEPAQNESVPVLVEVLVRSGDQEPEQVANFDDGPSDTVRPSGTVTSKDIQKTPATSGNDGIGFRVDTLELSTVDVNKDVVSSILGDTSGMDAEDHSGSEQKFTESDEGFQQKESGGVPSDMIDEQLKEQANDRTLDDQDHAAETDDLNLDDDKSTEDGFNTMGNMNDTVREQASPFLYTKEDSSEPVGDVDAHESHTANESFPFTYEKEEPPVEGTDPDLPTMTEDVRPMQEETQIAVGSPDWGECDFEMDDFEKPDSANIGADIPNEGQKNDQESDFQTFATASFFMKESSGPAAGVDTSVRKLEKDSIDATDGKSNSVDMLNESANTATDMTEETLNWSDSSLKSSVTTPSATQFSHVKDNHEDATVSASRDYYSSLKPMFATLATTQISHIKTSRVDATDSVNEVPYSYLNNFREDAPASVNEDPYSPLKPIFTTPATTQISHIKNSREDAPVSVNKDPYSSLKPMFTTPGTTQISHIENSREYATASVNDDPYSSLKPMFATPSTTQLSDIKNSREYATASVNEDLSADSSLKPMCRTPATTQISHIKNSRVDLTASANEDPCETQGPAERVSDNVMYGVQSSEYYHLNLNEDTSTQFEFRGVHVDQTKQFEFLSDGAGASHAAHSGLKDDSIHSSGLEKKDDLTMKGSEFDDDFAFSKG